MFPAAFPFRSISLLPVGEPREGNAKGAVTINCNRTGAHLSVRSPSPRFTGDPASGLTLLELLVVLVLASLLGVLVIQGTGFFLGRYERVAHVGRSSSQAVLQQHWFVSTVQGMVPSLRSGWRFEGDGTSIAGVTMQPLAAQSGRPVRVQWRIDPSDDGSPVVRYAEEDGEEWTVLTATETEVSFQYADPAGRWHDHWPLDGRPRQALPGMVRLVAETGRTVWVARPALFPEPVVNFRDNS